MVVWGGTLAGFSIMQARASQQDGSLTNVNNTVFLPMVTTGDSAEQLLTEAEIRALMQEMNVVADEREIVDQEPSGDEIVALGVCYRSTIGYGNSGFSVRLAQDQLLKVGGTIAAYVRNAGGADGYFGWGTWHAVFNYQKLVFPNQPSEWDGRIGPKTWEKLGCSRYDNPVGAPSSPSPAPRPTPRPTAAPSPQIQGSLVQVTSPSSGYIQVKGWAYLTTNRSDKLSININISGVGNASILANRYYYNVGYNGFDATLSGIPGGRYLTVCATARSNRSFVSKSLGCKSVYVQGVSLPPISKSYNSVSTYDCRTGPVPCDAVFSDNGYSATRYVNICGNRVNNVRVCTKLAQGTFTIPNSRVTARQGSAVALVNENSESTPFYGCSVSGNNTICGYEVLDMKNLTGSSGWSYMGDKFKPWAIKQANLAHCALHISLLNPAGIGHCVAGGALNPYNGN